MYKVYQIKKQTQAEKQLYGGKPFAANCHEWTGFTT